MPYFTTIFKFLDERLLHSWVNFTVNIIICSIAKQVVKQNPYGKHVTFFTI